VYRYCDPHAQDVPFHREAVDRYLPVDVYVGGIEHAAQHLLYLRFVARALHRWGLAGADEPVAGFVCNGMVLGADGRKMSKSAGNGVDPDAVIAAHGPDALRLAILADAPVERDVPWDEGRAASAARLLDRTARAIGACAERDGEPGSAADWPDPGRVRAIAGILGALDRDIVANAMHCAVARVHELWTEVRAVLAEAGRAPAAARAILRDALVATEPLVPGWVERLWPASYGPIAASGWPAPEAPAAPERTVAIQIDGRTVAAISVPADAGAAEIRAAAERTDAVQARLAGRTVAREVYVPGRLLNLVLYPEPSPSPSATSASRR